MLSYVAVDTIKNDLEKRASLLFDAKIKSAHQIDSRYAFMWGAIKDQFMGGGKRIRPMLVASVMRAYGKQLTSAHIDIALAHEFLHVALLMHDDIIDNDLTRHGKQNISGTYMQKYSTVASKNQATHYSAAAALLAGDLLISAAYELINAADIDQHQKAMCVQYLSHGIFEVAGGELLDVEASFYSIGEYDPNIINRYKTSGYSFVSPILTGAALADAASDSKSLREFAIVLGEIFQLQDDYLGVFGDQEITGKSVTSDIAEAKYTVLIQAHISTLGTLEKANFINEFTAKNKSTACIDSIKKQLKDSGTKAYLETRIRELSSELENLMNQINFTDPTALARIVDAIQRRQA